MTGLLRNLGWLLGSRGLNALLSLVYLGLVTRTLGLEDFGRFTLIVVLSQALAGVVSFQTWQAVVRWGAIAGEEGAAAGFALALDLVSMAVGLVVAGIGAALLGWWQPGLAGLGGLAFVQCAAALLAIRSTPTGLLRLRDRYDLASLADASQPAVRAAGAGLAAWFGAGLPGFVAAWAAADLACAASYWLLARRMVHIRRREVNLRAMPARHGGLWRFVWGTNLSRSVAVTGKQVLLLVIGAAAGPTIAGGYRVAAQLGTALVQLGEALSRAIFPELVRAEDAALALVARVAGFAGAAGAIAVALAWLLGERAIVALAGPGFAFTSVALVILAAAGAFDLVSASWEALLVARQRAMTALAIRAVPLLLAMAAMPGLVVLGLDAIAVAVAVASAATALGLGFQVFRRPAVTAASPIR